MFSNQSIIQESAVQAHIFAIYKRHRYCVKLYYKNLEVDSANRVLMIDLIAAKDKRIRLIWNV